MSDLADLDTWASGLVAALDSKSRRQLAREVARSVAAAQADRIRQQRNPDGTAYAPRKLRKRKGSLRQRAMFSKLRTAKYLRTEYSQQSAVITFAGTVQHMAQVHQLGLRDRVSRKLHAPEIQYAKRELLGVTDTDRALLADIILKHLSA